MITEDVYCIESFLYAQAFMIDFRESLIHKTKLKEYVIILFVYRHKAEI